MGDNNPLESTELDPSQQEVTHNDNIGNSSEILQSDQGPVTMPLLPIPFSQYDSLHNAHQSWEYPVVGSNALVQSSKFDLNSTYTETEPLVTPPGTVNLKHLKLGSNQSENIDGNFLSLGIVGEEKTVLWKKYLPLGFRFVPTGDQLLDYLRRRVLGIPIPEGIIQDMDVYSCRPHDLKGYTTEPNINRSAYFFTPTYKFSDNPNSKNQKRTTRDKQGSWKNTTAPFPYDDGKKTTLVYHLKGSGNTGKTNYIMHEYMLNDYSNAKEQNMALCYIYERSQGSASGPEEDVDSLKRKGTVSTNEQFVQHKRTNSGCQLSLGNDGNIKDKSDSILKGEADAKSPQFQQKTGDFLGLGHDFECGSNFYGGKPLSSHVEDAAPIGSHEFARTKEIPPDIFQLSTPTSSASPTLVVGSQIDGNSHHQAASGMQDCNRVEVESAGQHFGPPNLNTVAIQPPPAAPKAHHSEPALHPTPNPSVQQTDSVTAPPATAEDNNPLCITCVFGDK